jgi:hypothetical protein
MVDAAVPLAIAAELMNEFGIVTCALNPEEVMRAVFQVGADIQETVDADYGSAAILRQFVKERYDDGCYDATRPTSSVDIITHVPDMWVPKRRHHAYRCINFAAFRTWLDKKRITLPSVNTFLADLMEQGMLHAGADADPKRALKAIKAPPLGWSTRTLLVAPHVVPAWCDKEQDEAVRDHRKVVPLYDDG